VALVRERAVTLILIIGQYTEHHRYMLDATWSFAHP